MYLRASHYFSTILLAPQYNEQLHFSMYTNSNTNYVINKCISNWNFEFVTVTLRLISPEPVRMFLYCIFSL